MIKVALYELGHNLGLDHCPTPTCLMRDAKGGNLIDEEKDYCDRCKNILDKKYNKIQS